MPIEPGTIYFIPHDYHGKVIKKVMQEAIVLNKGSKVNSARPSIDILMKSVAEVFRENSIGVLLTGMGHDGALGIKAIKNFGGMTIVQDRNTSSVFSMPKSAIELYCVDRVLPLQEIPGEILQFTDEKSEAHMLDKPLQII